MSGGSLNYAFGRVNDIAEELELKFHYSSTPELLILRRNTIQQLRALSELLRAIEWNMIADTSPEDELKAYRKYFEDIDLPYEKVVLSEVSKALLELQLVVNNIAPK